MKVDVLDHGFVILRNISGPTRRATTDDGVTIRDFDADDVDPAQAARMSFDQMDSDRTPEQDHKLAAYLMRNQHTSPFEMVECWIEMKLPIFVARQFVRHRTVSLNEVSGRYVTLPEEWYVPEVVGGKAPDAKQGQADNLSSETQSWFQEALNLQCAESYSQYLEAIARGVAPEHARLLLHLNHYTHWLWKQDLHNVMHFLRLRDHSHAQVEAQAYARAVDRLLREQLPVSMTLYDEHRRMT
jgi:thymidylate synthase (FAD)